MEERAAYAVIDPEALHPLICNYQGRGEHRVHPEVCLWHLERQDPECQKCPNNKSI